MSSAPTPAERPDDQPHPATGAHPHAPVLDALIGMGANLARLLHDRAVAQASQPNAAPRQPAPAQAPDPLVALAKAFDGAARTVRRCILLAQRLAQPAKPAPDPARHRAQARKRILREVEDTIAREAHEGGRAEALAAELHERLDAPDLDGDLAHRPIPDVIAEICRDLGLAAHPGTNPWKRRTPQDLADLHARAAAPSRTGTWPPGQGAQHAPAEPPPADPAPSGPAAIVQAAPARLPGNDLPDDPAGTISAFLRHPARARWRPPPGA